MKNKTPIFLAAITMLIISCSPLQRQINCNIEKDAMISKLEEIYYADSVSITTVALQEEIYFLTSHAIKIIIYNPTTEVIDYKRLSWNDKVGIDNYSEVKQGLYVEGETVSDILQNHCDLSHFDELILYFTKGYSNNWYVHRISCQYDLN